MLHRNATLLVAAVGMTVTAVQVQAQASYTERGAEIKKVAGTK